MPRNYLNQWSRLCTEKVTAERCSAASATVRRANLFGLRRQDRSWHTSTSRAGAARPSEMGGSPDGKEAHQHPPGASDNAQGVNVRQDSVSERPDAQQLLNL